MTDYPHVQAEIIANSRNPHTDQQLTTFVLTYPRFIHAEFMTHRMFSRNAQSSRAIPVKKRLIKVSEDPVVPIQFLKNQRGMQAMDEEVEDPEACLLEWRWAANRAVEAAENLMNRGLHKQWTNRLLEPFETITVIVTATEWENFFALRTAPDAQPEIRYLAKLMLDLYQTNIPVVTDAHIPWYVEPLTTDQDVLKELFGTVDYLWLNDNRFYTMAVASAKCARVSYLSHDGTEKTDADELLLFDKLVRDFHQTPLEHCALALAPGSGGMEVNFKGWRSFRHIVADQQGISDCKKM